MGSERHESQLGSLCSFLNRGAVPVYDERGAVIVLNQKCVRDQKVSFAEARKTNSIVKPTKGLDFDR